MEELSSQLGLWLIGAAAGGIVETISGDTVLGNFAQLRENLKQYKPDENHEIQEAVLCSYLQANLQVGATYCENLGYPVNPYLIDLLPRIVGKAKVYLHKATSNNPLAENAEELYRSEYRQSKSFVERCKNKLLGENPQPLQLSTSTEKEWLDRVINEYSELLIQFSQKKLKFPNELENEALNTLLGEKGLLMQVKNTQERGEEIRKSLLEQVEKELFNKFGEMPGNFKTFFEANWFNYFCGCFQYQLSRKTELARKFQARILAKIEGDTVQIIKALNKFSGKFGERLTKIESSLDWLEKRQGEGFDEIKQLLHSMIPLFAVVQDQETRNTFFSEIKVEFSFIIDEINTFTEKVGNKILEKQDETTERIIREIRASQPKPLPKTIPFID